MINKRKTLYNITFTLNINDYYNYNKIVFSELIHKKQKRLTILGILAVTVAAFVLSTFLITSELEVLFIALDILLILSGIFCIIYYPAIFSRVLKKTVIKTYKLKNLAYEKITLEFSETHITQIIQGENPQIITNNWQDFKEIFIYNDYTVLLLFLKNGVYIPSRILDKAYDAKLKSFIIAKAEDVDMKILYEK